MRNNYGTFENQSGLGSHVIRLPSLFLAPNRVRFNDERIKSDHLLLVECAVLRKIKVESILTTYINVAQISTDTFADRKQAKDEIQSSVLKLCF